MVSDPASRQMRRQKMQLRIRLSRLKRFLHLGQVPNDRLSVELDDVLLVGVRETFESYTTMLLAYTLLKRHNICPKPPPELGGKQIYIQLISI